MFVEAILGAVTILAGLAVIVAQGFNMVARRIRIRVSLAGTAVVAAAVLLENDIWKITVGTLVVGTGLVLNNQHMEVVRDRGERKLAGLKLLAKPRLHLNAALDPSFDTRYRRLMFRDDWSRGRLLRVSHPAPWPFNKWQNSEAVISTRSSDQ